MSYRKSLHGLMAGVALAWAIGGFGANAVAQSAQPRTDEAFKKVISAFGYGIGDYLERCIAGNTNPKGKAELCHADGPTFSIYSGDFGIARLGGAKIPSFGTMFFAPGKLTPTTGVFAFLKGTKFKDGIISHVPRFNGTVLVGSKLPGKLGKAVRENFGGRIIVDGGMQFIARAEISGVVGTVLKTFGFPTGNVLLRAGKEVPLGKGGLIAGSGRTNPKDKKGDNIPNGFVEMRVPGVWKNPMNWPNTSLRETLVFADQEGAIRMEGILSFNDDKRKPKREFAFMMEMPASTANVVAARRMKIGFASPSVSLRDALKLSASMAAAGPGPQGALTAFSKLKNPLNQIANLLPDIISINNPKWGKDFDLKTAASPFPTAEKFNFLFLATPLASHKVEVTNDKGKKSIKTIVGPHLQVLGDLEIFGLNFAGVDMAIGPSVKGNNRAGWDGASNPFKYIKVLAHLGKNPQSKRRQARAAGAPFGGHATLSLEDGLKVTGGIQLPKPFGGRDFKVVINGNKALFSSPATCHFPFNLRFEAPIAQFDLKAITTVFKNAESFVPDGSTLVKCAGAIFYAMKDGVVYAFNGTAELASLVVTDPAAAAAKIGEGAKMVAGKMVAAPGEAAEAALKIGGKLGQLGANVGGEVVGQLGKVGGEALKAGNAAGNAIKNIGGGIASGAKKVGCSLGLGGCKKKRPPPPGRKVAWQKLDGSGYDVSASGNVDENIWMLGGDYRFWALEKGARKFLKTPAYPTSTSKTEIRDFRKIALGPKDALLATDKNGKLYYSNGKRNSNRLVVQQVRGVTAVDVGISGSFAWILSTQKTSGGYKIYRSAFDGTLKSLKFKPVSGGATTLDVDAKGNAWIVADGWQIKKYSGSKWQNVPPILSAAGVKKTWINEITVDKYDRPWVSLGFASDAERMKLAKFFGGSTTSYNLFALTPNGWQQYQGGTLQISARRGHIWMIGNGGKRKYYRAALPEYISEGPADDWRYTLVSEASTKDDFCLYAEAPTKSRPSYVGQPVVLRACANTPRAQEQFHLQNVDSTYIRVVSTTTKLCVGLDINRNKDADQVQYLPCSSADKGQHWLLTTKDGTYSLKSRHSAKCLRVAGGEAKKDATLEQGSCASVNAQNFAIGSLHKEKLASGITSKPVAFKSAPSSWDRVLQVKDRLRCISNNPKYDRAYAWDCGRTNDNQDIRMIPLKAQKGFVWLYAPKQKKCLSPVPIFTTVKVSGTNVIVPKGFSLAGTKCQSKDPFQAWGILPAGQDWFQLVNRKHGTCVTRPSGKKGAKNQFFLATCDARTDTQKFRFYDVAAK
jgi:hypothetical protein